MDDPPEEDIDDFDEADILQRIPAQASTSTSSSSAAQRQPPSDALSHILNPRDLPPSSGGRPTQTQYQTTTNPASYSHFQILYPLYFDSTRSRAQGRRVSSNLAVKNPLAHDIASACASLSVPFVFEPTKTHPKDWANTGRVRVALKETPEAKVAVASASKMRTTRHSSVQNKHHLYILVAEYLRKHPTTDTSAGLSVRLPGAPPPPDLRGKVIGGGGEDGGEKWPRPAVPRGWKMGELLPYYSPAMTGGGVSENLFKDMMKEMQGGEGMAGMLGAAGGGGAGGGGGGGGAIEGKAKKDKKGKRNPKA
jgi:signal recognition particle subunit SRP19